MPTPCVCCGTQCCPNTPLKQQYCATVTSDCAALNGSVVLNLTRLEDGSICWSGETPISGCFLCTRLIVSLCCVLTHEGFQWGIAWHVERADNILCVVIQSEISVTTQTISCGPPLTGELVSTHLTLLDPGPGPPGPGTCCSDFTITIDVAECS